MENYTNINKTTARNKITEMLIESEKLDNNNKENINRFNKIWQQVISKMEVRKIKERGRKTTCDQWGGEISEFK